MADSSTSINEDIEMNVIDRPRDERRPLLAGDTLHGRCKKYLPLPIILLSLFVGVVCFRIGFKLGVNSVNSKNSDRKHQPAPQFREHFIGKCENFTGKKDVSCACVFDAFENAFFGENKNNVTEEKFEGLFQSMPFTHPGDKTMLWSGMDRNGTDDLVHRFTKSGDHFFTLEDTLLGYVMDGLTWCGKVESKGIVTDNCNTAKPNPISSFWKKASAKIAQYASGTVTVMLNGTKDEPYSNKTAFVEQEVPNFQSPQVKKLLVIVVVLKDCKQCNKTSLQKLSETVKLKNIEYDCKEVTQAHIEECITKKTTGSCW